MYKITLDNNYKEFHTFLTNIKHYFNSNNQSIHKARNELKIIDYNNINTIVKSFKIPNFFRKVVYTYFRDSKAKKSYEYSVKLKNFTPTPIGYIEFYANGLINDSYFVSEKFNYDFTIREPLLDNFFEDKEEILRAFARFTLALHEEEIFHKDYSPGNILIKKENKKFIFKVVDVNRMTFGPLSEQERAENFSKLWASNDELTIIADEYTKYYNCSSDFAQKVCDFSNRNKRIKNFKKRLKGQEAND